MLLIVGGVLTVSVAADEVTEAQGDVPLTTQS